MEEMLNKEKNISFSGAVALYQNWAAERAIKTVGIMARTMFIRAVLRCPDDPFPLIFGQLQYIMLYRSKIGSLEIILDHPLFKYGQI